MLEWIIETIQHFIKRKDIQLIIRVHPAELSGHLVSRQLVTEIIRNKFGSNKNNILESLPEDFYNYREKVSYNNSFLKDYFMYNAFLRSNFDNIALKEHYKHSKDKHHKISNICYR